MSTDDDAVLLARETRAIEHERERMGLHSGAPGRGNGATRLGRRWDGKGGTGIAGDPPPPLRFKSASAFCAEYVPLAYIIEGLLRSSSLYALTAKTGAGKTAFNIIVALAVATGRPDILGIEVTRGRVAYFAFENPDDARMRLRIAAFLWGVDLDELGDRLVILDRREKPEHICAEIQRLAEMEPFALVIVDTFAAFFDGDDVNNAVQAGEFMRRCRPLTQIPGAPAVLVSAHPVKNASEEQLIPYGSGAILNEVDGNLTLWKSGEPAQTKLHWQGKLRGLEFQPLNFRFETTGCPDVLDVKGRQIELPTMLPATQQSAEERENAEHDAGRALLRALMEEPGASQSALAAATGCKSKGTIQRRLQKLKRDKLVKEALGKWTVTPAGREAVS
jgi:hypothetical protein